MFSMWRASLRRSWLSFVVIGVLYLLSYIQISFYYYFKTLNEIQNPLLETGYIIGIVGFAGGILGLQFLLIKQYIGEMGNLETMGYKRSSYIPFYLAQFAVVCTVAFLAAVAAFGIAYSMEIFKQVATESLIALHLTVSWRLFALYSGSMLLFLIIQSGKDPLLMVRER